MFQCGTHFTSSQSIEFLQFPLGQLFRNYPYFSERRLGECPMSGQSVSSHNGFIMLYRHIHKVGNGATERINFGRFDACAFVAEGKDGFYISSQSLP